MISNLKRVPLTRFSREMRKYIGGTETVILTKSKKDFLVVVPVSSPDYQIIAALEKKY